MPAADDLALRGDYSKGAAALKRRKRVDHLYAIAGREVVPEPGEPEVIFCVDEFGPLSLQPRPGRQRAAVSGKNKAPCGRRGAGCA